MKGALVFSEVVKFKPQVDNRDLNETEKKLNSRFNKVAKNFGKALKGAGIGALATGILDKLLNPLQDVKAAIDRTLGKADDVVTNAKQFQTTTANMLKLRALADINGMGPEQMDMLLGKYQSAIAQFKLNPKDESVSSVANYAGEKDMAVGFFNFLKGMQAMNSDQRTLVQTQIFGEKQLLKMAELMQGKWKESAMILKDVDFEKVAAAAEKLEDLEGKQRANRTVNGLNDLLNKSKVIGAGTIANVNRSEINAMNRENGQIARSAQSFSAEENVARMTDELEKLSSTLLTAIPEVFTVMKGITGLLQESIKGWKMIIDLIRSSPMMKGIGATLKSLNPFGSDE